MEVKQITDLKNKINEEIVKDDINRARLLEMSQELDLLIVEIMKEQIKIKA